MKLLNIDINELIGNQDVSLPYHIYNFLDSYFYNLDTTNIEIICCTSLRDIQL